GQPRSAAWRARSLVEPTTGSYTTCQPAGGTASRRNGSRSFTGWLPSSRAQHPLRQPDPGPKVLLATTSRGKVREWRELLAGLPVELLLPADLGIVLEVEETGTTFRANADIKARAYHAALGEQAGIWTLAEDSG